MPRSISCSHQVSRLIYLDKLDNLEMFDIANKMNLKSNP